MPAAECPALSLARSPWPWQLHPVVVSVRDLENRTSEFLRRVRAGGRLVVTHRGRPVAEQHDILAWIC
jgi:hypothetical protein